MEPLLITKADIAEYFDVPAGLREERLNPEIRKVQLQVLKPAITTDLYTDLNTAIAAVVLPSDEDPVGVPLAVHWVDLKAAIKPVLVYYSWAEYVLFSQATVTSNSIVRKTDLNSEPLDGQTVAMLHKNLKNTGNYYLGLLQKYLKDNRSLYPSYPNYCGTSEGSKLGGDTMIRI
jgi:hypothetical protein